MTSQVQQDQISSTSDSTASPAGPTRSWYKNLAAAISAPSAIGAILIAFGGLIWRGGEATYASGKLAGEVESSKAIAQLTADKAQEAAKALKAEGEVQMLKEQVQLLKAELASKEAQIMSAAAKNQEVARGLAQRNNCDFLKARLAKVDDAITWAEKPHGVMMTFNGEREPLDPVATGKVADLRSQRDALVKEISSCL